jgi:hypothetical protein
MDKVQEKNVVFLIKPISKPDSIEHDIYHNSYSVAAILLVLIAE